MRPVASSPSIASSDSGAPDVLTAAHIAATAAAARHPGDDWVCHVCGNFNRAMRERCNMNVCGAPLGFPGPYSGALSSAGLVPKTAPAADTPTAAVDDHRADESQEAGKAREVSSTLATTSAAPKMPATSKAVADITIAPSSLVLSMSMDSTVSPPLTSLAAACTAPHRFDGSTSAPNTSLSLPLDLPTANDTARIARQGQSAENPMSCATTSPALGSPVRESGAPSPLYPARTTTTPMASTPEVEKPKRTRGPPRSKRMLRDAPLPMPAFASATQPHQPMVGLMAPSSLTPPTSGLLPLPHPPTLTMPSSAGGAQPMPFAPPALGVQSLQHMPLQLASALAPLMAPAPHLPAHQVQANGAAFGAAFSAVPSMQPTPMMQPPQATVHSAQTMTHAHQSQHLPLQQAPAPYVLLPQGGLVYMVPQ